MSFRDDHDAALMRADAAERERALAEAEAKRLAAELAEAREWLGGPRKRRFVLAGAAVAGVGLVLLGVVIGRHTAPPVVERRAAAANPPPPLPQVAGVIVADGPDVGHWTLAATRCVPREGGVELTATGGTGISIWLTNDQVELELPAGTKFLTRKECITKLVAAVARTDDTPPLHAGHVELDCSFDTNRLQGRIDFQHCR